MERLAGGDWGTAGRRNDGLVEVEGGEEWVGSAKWKRGCAEVVVEYS